MRIDSLMSTVQNLIKDSNSQAQAPDQEFKKFLDQAVASREDKQLMDAAKQFEALFVYQMFERMRQTAPDEGLFPKSTGEKIFQSMLDQKLSEEAAETKTLGLAEIIYQQLKTK